MGIVGKLAVFPWSKESTQTRSDLVFLSLKQGVFTAPVFPLPIHVTPLWCGHVKVCICLWPVLEFADHPGDLLAHALPVDFL